METRKPNLEIYTEMTPNPDSLKFVLNRMLLYNQSVDFRTEESAKDSQLATELFGFPSVKGVFISNNFITITKAAEEEWNEIIPTLKQFIKDYINDDKVIVPQGYVQQTSDQNGNASDSGGDTVEKIKQLLDQYVKPAVEMDGGAIQFKSFDDGVLTLVMQGSCSGCPSSTFTLKAGIEGMMKRMVPEVQEVVAEAG